jgi:DNA-binding response OmpR family regulator
MTTLFNNPLPTPGAPTMHVLLCEDDDLIASGICAGLTAQGFTVDRVGNASQARQMLRLRSSM